MSIVLPSTSEIIRKTLQPVGQKLVSQPTGAGAALADLETSQTNQIRGISNDIKKKPVRYILCSQR
jgi:hypothetical protein